MDVHLRRYPHPREDDTFVCFDGGLLPSHPFPLPSSPSSPPRPSSPTVNVIASLPLPTCLLQEFAMLGLSPVPSHDRRFDEGLQLHALYDTLPFPSLPTLFPRSINLSPSATHYTIPTLEFLLRLCALSIRNHLALLLLCHSSSRP